MGWSAREVPLTMVVTPPTLSVRLRRPGRKASVSQPQAVVAPATGRHRTLFNAERATSPSTAQPCSPHPAPEVLRSARLPWHAVHQDGAVCRARRPGARAGRTEAKPTCRAPARVATPFVRAAPTCLGRSTYEEAAQTWRTRVRTLRGLARQYRARRALVRSGNPISEW